jgi:cell division protease FtsH
MVMPAEDKYSTTRNELLDQLAYAMGGRVAEEIVFHDPTTGASNDIEKATAVARAMVTQYGMTERLGAIRFGQEQGEVFLGRDMGHVRDYSETVAGIIDDEVRTLIENAHMEAYEILVENRDVLDRLVLELMEKETLDKEEVAEIFAGLRQRPERPKWTGSPNRLPQAGPVAYVRPEVPALANGASTNGSATNGSAANGAANGHATAHGSAPVQDASAAPSGHDDSSGNAPDAPSSSH